MRNITYIQTELASEERRMTTLLPRDSRVKVGTVITLAKDDTDTRWEVISQSDPIESNEINRGWNNNI